MGQAHRRVAPVVTHVASLYFSLRSFLPHFSYHVLGLHWVFCYYVNNEFPSVPPSLVARFLMARLRRHVTHDP